MRTAPRRSSLLQLLAVFGSFLAGPLLGARVAVALAPDSTVAPMLGAAGFCLAFVLGLFAWFGAGVFRLAQASWRRRREGAPRSEPSQAVVIPPGYRAFVWLGLALSSSVGFFVGLLSTHGLLVCGATFAAAGFAYGATLHQLAHHGYLPFPDPE